jgi:hypothetical protein
MEPFPSAVSAAENTALRMTVWSLPLFHFQQAVADADDETFENMAEEVHKVWDQTVLQGIALLMNAICDPEMKVPLYEAVKNAAFKAGVPHANTWQLLTLEYFGVYIKSLRETRLQDARERARNLLVACEKEHLITLYEQAMQEVDNVTARKGIIRDRQRRERAKMPRFQPTSAPQPTNQATRNTDTSTRIIPDAPGQDHEPDPVDVATVEQLVDLLGKLHVWAGEKPLRELSRNINGEVAHSTFSVMLNNRSKLPPQRTLVSFVRALGCAEDDVSRWVSAWRRVRNNRSRQV